MPEKKHEKGLWRRTYRIFREVKIPVWLYLIQIALGIISAKVSLMYVPYYTQMQTGSIDNFSVVALYIGFLTLGTIMSMGASIPTFYANAKLGRRLKNRLIRRILHLPMNVIESERPGTLITRVTMDLGYVEVLMTAVCSFFVSMASAVMTFAAMNSVDNFLSFIIVPVILFIIAAAWVEGKLTFHGNRRQRKAFSVSTAYFAEHTAFLRSIKQMNGQKSEISLGDRIIDEMYHADIYYAILRFLTILVSSSTSKLIPVLVFALGAPKVRSGELDLVSLVAFYNFINIAYSNLIILPSIYQTLMQTNGALYYVGLLMEHPEEQIVREKEMPAGQENIRVSHVRFGYTPENPVLEDVSFTIPNGKVTALVGTNGCGKSTVFKLLERFYEPESGTIYLGEEDVSKIHLDAWRRSIGYVLQNPQLFNASIRENICYGVDEAVSEERLKEVTRLACAYDFIMERPEGFDFIIGDNGCRLSEGQKQRIAIARTILINPNYLLLDEATSSMDVIARTDVKKALRNLMKNRTTVFISHDAQMIRRADHVVVLDGGRVAAEGTHQEILNSCQIYSRMMEECEKGANL